MESSTSSNQAFPIFGRSLEAIVDAQQATQPGLYIPSAMEGAIKCVITRKSLSSLHLKTHFFFALLAISRGVLFVSYILLIFVFRT